MLSAVISCPGVGGSGVSLLELEILVRLFVHLYCERANLFLVGRFLLFASSHCVEIRCVYVQIQILETLLIHSLSPGLG